MGNPFQFGANIEVGGAGAPDIADNCVCVGGGGSNVIRTLVMARQRSWNLFKNS